MAGLAGDPCVSGVTACAVPFPAAHRQRGAFPGWCGDSHVVAVEGDSIVRGVVIENLKTKAKSTHAAGGVFFAVGHTPNTAFLNGQVHLHDNGYIKVKPGTCQTNVDLIYAAGDVQDHVYRQAITAAGSGCMAAIEAERELSARGIIA